MIKGTPLFADDDTDDMGHVTRFGCGSSSQLAIDSMAVDANQNGRVSASEASLHASYGAISVLTSAADTINRAKKAGIVT